MSKKSKQMTCQFCKEWVRTYTYDMVGYCKYKKCEKHIKAPKCKNFKIKEMYKDGKGL